MYLDSMNLDGGANTWAAGSEFDLPFNNNAFQSPAAALEPEPIDWAAIDLHFDTPSERASSRPAMPTQFQPPGPSEWPMLDAARDIVGKSLGLIPDPFCLQAGRDFVDPEVPAWAKPGALFVKGACDLRDVGTSLVVRPLAELAYLGPPAMGALGTLMEATATQLLTPASPDAALKLVEDGLGALLSGAGDTAATAGRALRDTAVDFTSQVGQELGSERAGLGVGTLLSAAAAVPLRRFNVLVFGGRDGIAAARSVDEHIDAMPGFELKVQGYADPDRAAGWWHPMPHPSAVDETADALAARLRDQGLPIASTNLLVGLQGSAPFVLPLSARYGTPLALIDDGPHAYWDAGSFSVAQADAALYARANTVFRPVRQQVDERLAGMNLENLVWFPPDANLRHEAWDALNPILSRAVQPDGSVLNLERGMKAGLLGNDEFRALTTYERPHLGPGHSTRTSVYSTKMTPREIDIANELQAAGVVRVTPEEPGVVYLGRDVEGTLRSVLQLPESAGPRYRFMGHGAYRPVLPGDPQRVYLQADPLKAMATRFQTGSTVIVADLLADEWWNPLGSGAWVAGAKELRFASSHRTSAASPAAWRDYMNRYDEMLQKVEQLGGGRMRELTEVD